MDKGFAYEVNGSVYFRVSEHPKYGSLASLDMSGMEVSGVRVMLLILSTIVSSRALEVSPPGSSDSV